MLPNEELVPVKRITPQSSWSWISIDATGKKTVLDVDKYVIMHRVQIHARDLRILDPNLFYPSAILGRERAIVLNLEHIKAIITAKEDSSDENLIPTLEEFQTRLSVGNKAHGGQLDGDVVEEDESAFEFRALEVALEAICSFLAARTIELEKSAYPALDELTLKFHDPIDSSGPKGEQESLGTGSMFRKEIYLGVMHKIKEFKDSLKEPSKLEYMLLGLYRVKVGSKSEYDVDLQIKDELEQLLEDDEDMAELYLSRKLAGASSPAIDSGEHINWYPTSPTIGAKISRAKSHLVRSATVRGDDKNDVEEVEMLLELREYVDETEDFLNIQFEIILTAGSICVSVYSVVVGILGMNIPFPWNIKKHMFKWVVSGTATVCAILFVIIMSFARYKKLFGF
ncbi:putative protein [Arabidopsis thaliana]|nr:putative protein [Arabidopsis thaliana]